MLAFRSRPQQLYDFESDVSDCQATNLKEGHCILFFRLRTRPKTFRQCFAIEQRKYKAKHCRNVIGREKIRYKFGP